MLKSLFRMREAQKGKEKRFVVDSNGKLCSWPIRGNVFRIVHKKMKRFTILWTYVSKSTCYNWKKKVFLAKKKKLPKKQKKESTSPSSKTLTYFPKKRKPKHTERDPFIDRTNDVLRRFDGNLLPRLSEQTFTFEFSGISQGRHQKSNWGHFQERGTQEFRFRFNVAIHVEPGASYLEILQFLSTQSPKTPTSNK